MSRQAQLLSFCQPLPVGLPDPAASNGRSSCLLLTQSQNHHISRLPCLLICLPYPPPNLLPQRTTPTMGLQSTCQPPAVHLSMSTCPVHVGAQLSKSDKQSLRSIIIASKYVRDRPTAFIISLLRPEQRVIGRHWYVPTPPTAIW